MWAVRSNGAAGALGGPLHVRLIDAGVVAEGTLRLPLGDAAGVKPTVDPVERIMVNVGSALGATGGWWRPVRPDAGWCGGGVAEPP
jgi:hypothetical protein